MRHIKMKNGLRHSLLSQRLLSKIMSHSIIAISFFTYSANALYFNENKDKGHLVSIEMAKTEQEWQAQQQKVQQELVAKQEQLQQTEQLLSQTKQQTEAEKAAEKAEKKQQQVINFNKKEHYETNERYKQ